jgi:hypothetical protein
LKYGKISITLGIINLIKNYKMKRGKILFAISFFCIVLFCNICSGQVKENGDVMKELFTCWHSIDHRYFPIYALTKEEVKDFSKRKICFNDKVVPMYIDTLYSPKYSIKKYGSKEYLWDNFQSKKEDIGIVTDSLYEIHISAMIKSPENGKFHKTERIIVYDGTYLFIFEDGVTFRLVNRLIKTEKRESGH